MELSEIKERLTLAQVLQCNLYELYTINRSDIRMVLKTERVAIE